MVKIRLMRVGKKKQPSFRVVVADSRSPRDGRIIEAIGHYHPRQDPSVINIDSDRAVYWLQRGAQPSESVKHLLRISGAWSEFSGEPAPAPLIPSGDAGTTAAPPATPTKETTAAARKKATPAASVTAAESVDDGDAAPAELPEAEDQQGAAPDADPDTA